MEDGRLKSCPISRSSRGTHRHGNQTKGKLDRTVRFVEDGVSGLKTLSFFTPFQFVQLIPSYQPSIFVVKMRLLPTYALHRRRNKRSPLCFQRGDLINYTKLVISAFRPRT